MTEREKMQYWKCEECRFSRIISERLTCTKFGAYEGMCCDRIASSERFVKYGDCSGEPKTAP